jgi:hypothetical protein
MSKVLYVEERTPRLINTNTTMIRAFCALCRFKEAVPVIDPNHSEDKTDLHIVECNIASNKCPLFSQYGEV